MWQFFVTLWNNSYHDTPWWGIALSLGVTLPFALIVVAWVIEVPLGFLYALFVWNPDRDQKKRREKLQALNQSSHPEIGQAREQYCSSRAAMLQTLQKWQAIYPFSSIAEDADPEQMMRNMERIWGERKMWSPYAFWVLWDNQLVLRTTVPEAACDEFEAQVQCLYQAWDAWMGTVHLCPDTVWDRRTGQHVYDWSTRSRS